jgi:hypothetical protein
MQIPYQTGSYSIYLPDGGMKLEGSSLQPGGPTQLGGQTYSLYTAANVARSTMIGGTLAGLGATAGLATNQLALMSLGVVLAVIGGGVILFGGRLRPHGERGGCSTPTVDDEQERLELVVRMAALDERFAAGEMSPADYEAERQRGKQRLRELTLARRQASVPAEG